MSQLSFPSASVNDFQEVTGISLLQVNDVKAPLCTEPTSQPSVGMPLERSLGEPMAVLPGQR